METSLIKNGVPGIYIITMIILSNNPCYLTFYNQFLLLPLNNYRNRIYTVNVFLKLFMEYYFCIGVNDEKTRCEESDGQSKPWQNSMSRLFSSTWKPVSKTPKPPKSPKTYENWTAFYKTHNTLIFYFKRFIYVKFGCGGQERIMKYMYWKKKDKLFMLRKRTWEISG